MYVCGKDVTKFGICDIGTQSQSRMPLIILEQDSHTKYNCLQPCHKGALGHRCQKPECDSVKYGK